MTIEEAVKRKIEMVIVEKKLCDASQVETISNDTAKNIYELFSVEINTLRDELKRQNERQERLWDQIFHAREPRLRFWNRLAFWRKNVD
jgi:hypothetical protein